MRGRYQARCGRRKGRDRALRRVRRRAGSRRARSGRASPGAGRRGRLGRMRIGVLCSRIRAEEKLLFEAFARRGMDIERMDDRELVFDLRAEPARFDVVLERCLHHSRALYALRILNQAGVPTVNTYEVALTRGDESNTTTALTAAGARSPLALIASTPEPPHVAIESLGYPVVLKPAVGSWGRLLAKI